MEVELIVEEISLHQSKDIPVIVDTKPNVDTKKLVPDKSSIKPSYQNIKSKSNQKITYDSILENMGLCVFNDKLQELSKQVENTENRLENTYPVINKKHKNIPQNGYIYSKFNKPVFQHQQQQQQQQQKQYQQQQQQQQKQYPQQQISTTEIQNKLIRQIVNNYFAKQKQAQNPDLQKKTLFIY